MRRPLKAAEPRSNPTAKAKLVKRGCDAYQLSDMVRFAARQGYTVARDGAVGFQKRCEHMVGKNQTIRFASGEAGSRKYSGALPEFCPDKWKRLSRRARGTARGTGMEASKQAFCNFALGSRRMRMPSAWAGLSRDKERKLFSVARRSAISATS